LNSRLNPQRGTTTGEIPAYHHPRIFKAIVSPLLTATPSTVICSIDDTAEAFDDIEDINFTKTTAEKYLETPIINPKTHTYHARIYIQSIKTLFIILKNEAIMGWLMQEKIYLEENDLDTIIPTNVGVLFFVHPRASLNRIHQQQLMMHLKGPEIPAFKIKSWKAKTQENEGRVYLIQASKADSDTVHRKFENGRKVCPYEYVSWKSWIDLSPDKKAALIDQHSEFQKDYRLLTLSGFTDKNDVPLGTIDKEPNEEDYSKMMLNAFVMKHYTIGTPPCQIISQVMGPIQGTRLFIVPASLDKVAKDLLESLQHDMLSYLSEEAGRLVIPNYDEKVLNAADNPIWEPNWFEEHIIPITKTQPQEEGRAVKRQKSEATTQESSTITVTPLKTTTGGNNGTNRLVPTQSAEAAKIVMLEQKIESLQTQQMDLLNYITDVKQAQHTNQTKLTTMSNKIEIIENNNQIALREIRSCKVNMAKVETVLSSLTTKQETEMAFNKILSMFGDVSEALRKLQVQGEPMNPMTNSNFHTVVLMQEEEQQQESTQTLTNHSQHIIQNHSEPHDGSGDHTNIHNHIKWFGSQVK
jgi:hypothetical protein